MAIRHSPRKPVPRKKLANATAPAKAKPPQKKKTPAAPRVCGACRANGVEAFIRTCPLHSASAKRGVSVTSPVTPARRGPVLRLPGGISGQASPSDVLGFDFAADVGMPPLPLPVLFPAGTPASHDSEMPQEPQTPGFLASPQIPPKNPLQVPGLYSFAPNGVDFANNDDDNDEDPNQEKADRSPSTNCGSSPLTNSGRRRASRHNPIFGFIEGATRGGQVQEIIRQQAEREFEEDCGKATILFNKRSLDLIERAESMATETSAHVFVVAHHMNTKKPFLAYASQRLRRDAPDMANETVHNFAHLFRDLHDSHAKDALQITKELNQAKAEAVAATAAVALATSQATAALEALEAMRVEKTEAEVQAAADAEELVSLRAQKAAFEQMKTMLVNIS
ncbi:hypothetical protein C8R43DRAFT_949439 [Mycena crocata]|nr:hypothetical protein C8R43DRAFT_949439 [Mycena crocata]